MDRSAWMKIWFGLALVLVLAAVGSGFVALASGFTAGDAIGSPPSFTPEGRQWIKQLERRGEIAEAGVIVAIVLASLCLGTGIRSRYKLPDVWAYAAAFVICPGCAIVVSLGLLALNDLFRSLN